MPLPDDVTTFNLLLGPYLDLTGVEALIGGGGNLYPVSQTTGKRTKVVHLESGTVILGENVEVTIDPDGTGLVEGLPHTGQSALSPFFYRLEWNIASNKPSPGNMTFIAPADVGGSLDYDLLYEVEEVPDVLIPLRALFDAWLAESGGGVTPPDTLGLVGSALVGTSTIAA